MTWKECLYAALLDFLQRDLGIIDAIEVTGLESDHEDRGYCDTCSYTVTVIKIDYRDLRGRFRTQTWEGSFAELIGRLAD